MNDIYCKLIAMSPPNTYHALTLDIGHIPVSHQWKFALLLQIPIDVTSTTTKFIPFTSTFYCDSTTPFPPAPQQGSVVGGEDFFTSREYRHLLTLAALLPQRVIEDLVNRRRLGKTAKPHFATESIEAALLFIDISGFTASMELFAQQGSQGIEKFWKMFNAYFCDLLDIIEVYI